MSEDENNMSDNSNTGDDAKPTPQPIPMGYFVPVEKAEQKEEIDLMQWLMVLANRKRLFIVSAFSCAFIAAAISLMMTPIYRAEVLLAPAQSSEKSSGLGALVGQFGGLADMAGISMPGGGGVDIALATLKSRRFIDLFVTEQAGKPMLFERRWNEDTNTWNAPFFLSPKAIKRMIIPRKEASREGLEKNEPTLLQTFKVFIEDVMTVITNSETGVVTVRIELRDPEVAANWANALVDQLNAEIRKGVIDESERAIAYLREQVESTSLAGLQAVMYSLIEEHTKNITLAKASDDYALKIIDPAVVPDESVRPNRTMMVIIGFLAGLMMAGFLALYQELIAQKRDEREGEPGTAG